MGHIIFKYRVPISAFRERFQVPMPKGPILSVQVQRGEPTVWVQIDARNVQIAEDPFYVREFQWVPTGRMVPDYGVYVGTIQLEGGELVFHLYETTRM